MPSRLTRDVDPRDAVTAGAEDKHVDEEEGDTRGCGGLSNAGVLEAQEDRDHHHANSQAKRSPHHRAATTQLVCTQSWDD